jgi:hypothetical protein
MGMSTHIMLLRDRNDPEHQKKAAVLKSCLEANVDVPEEIDKYFDFSDDPDYGLVIPFKAREYSGEGEEGLEIDISELPEGVKTIRFVNSY